AAPKSAGAMHRAQASAAAAAAVRADIVAAVVAATGRALIGRVRIALVGPRIAAVRVRRGRIAAVRAGAASTDLVTRMRDAGAPRRRVRALTCARTAARWIAAAGVIAVRSVRVPHAVGRTRFAKAAARRAVV